MNYAEVNLHVPGATVYYTVAMAVLALIAIGAGLDRKHNNNHAMSWMIWLIGLLLMLPVGIAGSIAAYDDKNNTTLLIHTGVMFLLGCALAVAAIKTGAKGLWLCALILLFWGCCGGLWPVIQPWPRF
jgi:hypothetical protein